MSTTGASHRHSGVDSHHGATWPRNCMWGLVKREGLGKLAPRSYLLHEALSRRLRSAHVTVCDGASEGRGGLARSGPARVKSEKVRWMASMRGGGGVTCVPSQTVMAHGEHGACRMGESKNRTTCVEPHLSYFFDTLSLIRGGSAPPRAKQADGARMTTKARPRVEAIVRKKYHARQASRQ